MTPLERENIYIQVRNHIADSIGLLDMIWLLKHKEENAIPDEEMEMVSTIRNSLEDTFLLLLPEAQL